MQIYQRTLSSKATTTHDGYKSIGSFHSDNVEELIRIPNDQYTPPTLPFDTSKEYYPHSEHTSNHSSTIPFANTQQYKKQYTNLDRTFTFLNHGAFGLALDVGLQRANSWRFFLEKQPLRYFDRYLLNHLVHSTRSLVDFVTNDDEEYNSLLREGTALLQNVTSGMNAVIGGHARTKKNGFVFYYDIGYGSTKKIAQTYHGENAISIPFEKDYLPQLQTIKSSSSFTRDENDWNEKTAEIYIHALDEAVHEIIKAKGRAAVHGSLLILDHITSNTAIHTPINAIAKYAKEEYGMFVVVDGAHSLLSLPLDMSTTLSSSSTTKNEGYADIYLTNCHKWLSSPRGVATLFCTNEEIRDTILSQPAVVSHGVNDGYLSRFIWDGCRDYSASLSLPIICDYWKSVNVDIVRETMSRNLKAGVRILISQWHGANKSNLDDFTLVPLDMHAPMMALVRLPDDISGISSKERKTSTDAKILQDYLYDNHVEVPIKCINGILFTRVSCHLYNDGREFERLAEVALKYKV